MVFLFSVPAFVIILRETLEITIILAVLLGFIDKLVSEDDALRRILKKKIWLGVAAGFGVSLLAGAIFIAIIYTIKKDVWENSEDAWEGSFRLIASAVITFMALSMLRVQQWRSKWEGKLKDASEKYIHKHKQGNKWALTLLPFTVVCRETVESIIFIAGIGFHDPASGLPIPVITGIICGIFIGFLIYKGSHRVSMFLFFNITTVFLLFVGAGLFSSSIENFQEVTGSYQQIVWELKCCNPENPGEQFWSLMESIFGWRNVATVGTTVGYFAYWFAIGLISLFMWGKDRRNENNAGLERNVQLSSHVNGDLEKDAAVVVIASLDDDDVEKDNQTVVADTVNDSVEKDNQIVVADTVNDNVEKDNQTVVVDTVNDNVEKDNQATVVNMEEDNQAVVADAVNDDAEEDNQASAVVDTVNDGVEKDNQASAVVDTVNDGVEKDNQAAIVDTVNDGVQKDNQATVVDTA